MLNICAPVVSAAAASVLIAAKFLSPVKQVQIIHRHDRTAGGERVDFVKQPSLASKCMGSSCIYLLSLASKFSANCALFFTLALFARVIVFRLICGVCRQKLNVLFGSEQIKCYRCAESILLLEYGGFPSLFELTAEYLIGEGKYGNFIV